MRHPREARDPQASAGRPAGPWAACLAWPNLRRTGVIAACVGAGLVLINQLPALAHGPRTAALWARVALDFLVPFAVSNLGVLTASRQVLRACGHCAPAGAGPPAVPGRQGTAPAGMAEDHDRPAG
jgi:hypothetical protein